MEVQARPVFFFSEREYKTNQKKNTRNSSIVRHVSKMSHPRLAARLIENDNNSKEMFSQKLEIISSISTSCVINIVVRILCFCKTEYSSKVDLLVSESKPH